MVRDTWSVAHKTGAPNLQFSKVDTKETGGIPANGLLKSGQRASDLLKFIDIFFGQRF